LAGNYPRRHHRSAALRGHGKLLVSAWHSSDDAGHGDDLPSANQDWGLAITAKSLLVEESGRAMKVAGSLTDEDEEVLARGQAELLVLSEEQKEKLGTS